MGSSTDMPCAELVELVTAYLDGALSPADREHCEEHCRICPGCRAYLAQMQLIVGSLGQLRRREEGENGSDRYRLLGLFRTRGLHSRAPRERSVPLGIAGAFAAPGDHIGYFWESEHEFDAAAGFLAAGVERDELCILLGPYYVPRQCSRTHPICKQDIVRENNQFVALTLCLRSMRNHAPTQRIVRREDCHDATSRSRGSGRFFRARRDTGRLGPNGRQRPRAAR